MVKSVPGIEYILRVREAARMRYLGASYREIADKFGVVRSTICQNWKQNPHWQEEMRRLREELPLKELGRDIDPIPGDTKFFLEEYKQMQNTLASVAKGNALLATKLLKMINAAIDEISSSEDKAEKGLQRVNKVNIDKIVGATTKLQQLSSSLYKEALGVDEIINYIEENINNKNNNN